jgi:hypothetical protein
MRPADVNGQLVRLREWAEQTVFFAMNQKVHGGVSELFEQMVIRAKAQTDRLYEEVYREAGADPGRMVILVPKKVFEWVETFLRAS